MWSRLLALALRLVPVSALAGVREKVAALAPSGVVLVVDREGSELVAQNADEPFIPASVTKIVTAWLALEVLAATTASRLVFISTTNACSTCAEVAILS
jgi:D-alanyl-D-alanine carboxypeptidase/D-alanyl-D-alanine-endopeptidase (penicillin-binding protein 4)